MNFSNRINNNNVNSVRQYIDQKNNYNRPFYPRTGTIKAVTTDMDTFPYPRFYRGEWQSQVPIVFDREAGWHPRLDKFYGVINTAKDEKPNHCFEAPCSTVYPCYPDYLKKYADKEELDLMLNRVCVAKSP